MFYFFALFSIAEAPSILTSNDYLKCVDYDHGFHFFSASGAYAGETAISLLTFELDLKTVDIRSIRYHLARKDFQRWITTVIGDETLARRIDELNYKGSDENLRKSIVAVLEKRLSELSST